MKAKGRSNLFYLYLVIPLLVILGALLLYPMIYTVCLSFYKHSPVYGTSFIGGSNYIKLLQQRLFLATIGRTFVYMGGVVVMNFLIGLGFAFLTYKGGKGSGVLRTILILPMLFIPAAGANAWALMLSEEMGLINNILSFLGLPRKMWLASPMNALLAVMITDIWSWTPFVYLILLAALQSLPREPLEAAEIDGASWFQKLGYITLPMMKPAIIITLIIKGVDTFRTFDYIWIMTRGGPGNSTQVLSTLIFMQAFQNFRFGRASTMSTIALLLAFTVAIPFLFILKEKK